MACRFWLLVYYFGFRKERDINMQQTLRPRKSLSFYGPSRREARRAWRARFRIKPVMYDLQPKSATETPWVLELLPLGCKVRNAVLLARPHLTAREAQRLHMSDTTRDSVISESAWLVPIKGTKKSLFSVFQKYLSCFTLAENGEFLDGDWSRWFHDVRINIERELNILFISDSIERGTEITVSTPCL